MQPTASPAPDVSISQDLRHAASVLSKFYEELPVILTRLLTAGAAIIIGLLCCCGYSAACSTSTCAIVPAPRAAPCSRWKRCGR